MIASFENLPDIRKQHEGEKIVFRGGCYDLLHEGHINGLAFAKKLGEILVVGIRPNARVTERKGPTRPIRDETTRAAVVDAIRYVDYAFVMPPGDDILGASSLRVVDALRPDIFIGVGTHVGSHPNDYKIQQMGAQVVLDHTPPYGSTTDIIKRILELNANNS
jgi:rfaE bifunctional protein nucleotidyltransferase chain/domain